MTDRTNFNKAEHLGYSAGKGVKRVSIFNDGVQTNVATEAKQDDQIAAIQANAFTVTNAIDQVAFDLNASAFTETTNISNDYVFDSIELNFSTSEAKTITITSSDGTILWGGSVDTSSDNLGYNTTSKNFNLCFSQAFNGGENITVAVTQFGSAGTMDCVLKVKQGGAGLTGNPVLGAGSEVIGKVRIVDENGVDVTDPDENCVDVCIQNQSTEPIELYMAMTLGSVTLASNTTLDTKTVELTAGHGASAGELLFFREGKHFLQARIINVSTNTITIDMPLDYAFTTSATVTRETNDMTVDGSSTSKVFSITPGGLDNVNFHIQRLRFHLQGTGVLDGTEFASISALTNGVVLRRKNGTYKNVGAVKTNSGFTDRTEGSYDDKPLYTLRCVKNIEEDFGVVFELVGADSDEIQLIIQDNLDVAGVAAFRCLAQGHVTKE